VSKAALAPRSVITGALTVLAPLLVWIALVVPDQLDRVSPLAFLRLPIEGLLILLVGLLLPVRVGRVVGVLAGIGLGALIVLKALNAVFVVVLGRPFNPVTDGSYLGSGFGVLQDAIGPGRALAVAVGAVLAVAMVVVLATAAVLRVLRTTVRRRGAAGWVAVALGVAWTLCAVLGVQAGGGPVAATSASAFTARTTAPPLATEDAYAATPGQDLLTGLRGKDVLVVFVESYGRVALQDPQISPPVLAALDRGDKRLHAAGFSARSGFLTSPTYAGLSWLAHSTLESGQWISDQGRYDKLLASQRLTLSSAFRRAGWRTVAAIPANTTDWPEGIAFYGYQHIYDSRNVGYAGPEFGYATMPDQYLLSAFQRDELAKPGHPPLMAEIDLVSSHGPWAPLPTEIGWNEVGNGSIYSSLPPAVKLPKGGWQNADQTKAAYAQSIRYTLDSLTSYIQTYGNKNLVLVVVGDHQPASVVSGQGSDHDVPISVIAKDPKVMAQIASWGWQDGLRPTPDAPVSGMDTFRDRFLSVFGSTPAPSPHR
jgi:hypothetical protein